MKHVLFCLPALPASESERIRIRPIGHRTDKWQQMFDEVLELAKMADDMGFEAISFPEHHLHSEGMEMGGPSSWYMNIANHTKRIKVGPLGYVLPAWNPIKLAQETAWLDQMTKGRTIVGMARGYQTRWFNTLTQHLGIQTASSDSSERDQMNRRLFEEVYQILKLAWKDEAFNFKGEFYQFPYPHEGHEWAEYPYTQKFGAEGEIGPDNLLKKISVVPKPYQDPHPKLFQAFSFSESTIRHCAREGITPIIITSWPDEFRRMAEAYRDEAAKVGRNLPLGKDIGVLRQVNFGSSKADALNQAQLGVAGYGWQNFWGYSGFYEAFRRPGETGKIPWTVEKMEEASYLYAGTVDDVRRGMNAMIEDVNPEYMFWWADQGLLPFSTVKRNLEIYGEKVMPDTLG